MKRVILTAAAFLSILQSYGQRHIDSTGFGSRKLKIEEINFISSYYSQTGNHASVTGGIGSQKLTDLANILDVNLVKYDKKYRKHTFGIEIGVDQYTSASSDMIDLKANSSSSHSDMRIYPSLIWNVENIKKGTSFTIGASNSSEFDYSSNGAHIGFSKKTNNKNGEFTVKLQTYFDQVKLVTPIELRANSSTTDIVYGTSSRNSFSGTFGYSQIINDRFQIMVMADIVQQEGYLSLPFHRVYFSDSSIHQENLPDSRFKLPIGVRASYFLNDRITFKCYYRFYTDNWGLNSHTVSLEVPVKIAPFFSISPSYRFYHQNASKYFAPYREHSAQDQYYTSNYDQSSFNSNFLGLNVRYAPPKGVLGSRHFTMIELRYGYYSRSEGLSSSIFTVNLKFK